MSSASLLPAKPVNAEISGFESSQFLTAGNDFSDHFVEKGSIAITLKNTLGWGNKGGLEIAEEFIIGLNQTGLK
jgi:hypothetical protein